jgi:hypothetical protein
LDLTTPCSPRIAELETDIHVHVHKENHVLFPAARRREEELAGASIRLEDDMASDHALTSSERWESLRSATVGVWASPTLGPWKSGPKPIAIRLVPDRLTGRRFKIDPAAGYTV